jgi:hypothetical protein
MGRVYAFLVSQSGKLWSYAKPSITVEKICAKKLRYKKLPAFYNLAAQLLFDGLACSPQPSQLGKAALKRVADFPGNFLTSPDFLNPFYALFR